MKREDIKKIMIIGSGPIVIGQACEFDYSGSQACKALKEEGYEIILVNSNPATIMTDPEMADKIYIEPLNLYYLEKIIREERPDALLPTVGGQTALNLTKELLQKGILDKYNVSLLALTEKALDLAEDRKKFREAMIEEGLEVPYGEYCYNIEEGLKIISKIGFPVVLRPSFALGGSGSGIAFNIEEFKEKLRNALKVSFISEVLIEEYLLGWKEFELEVMRDKKDNVVVICSIENVDPMGIHTGDSITVAPAQTLSDKEYQRMRDWAIRVIRKIGVETGGSNIQFATHPQNGKMVVIEMNPRVSRSSALASKATGFPIAKIAAKLAIGYTLDELPNDITKKSCAAFEPALDYVVVKIPRWDHEKFPSSSIFLDTQMKSIGETMAIGRSFKEALMKAIRSLEKGSGPYLLKDDQINIFSLEEYIRWPNPFRIAYLKYAIQSGYSTRTLSAISHIDEWFINQLEEIVELEGKLRAFSLDKLPVELLRKSKRMGFSDAHIAMLTGSTEDAVIKKRVSNKILPVYKCVDTCAAEFESYTPYYYSCYDEECECKPSDKEKIIILGSGPIRIGQGIEFDYCCCHALYALKEEGYESIIINNNPETVSTDYDTSDKLYFEPITLEDVMNVVEKEKPMGVIIQFGGQTPLKLAKKLTELGVKLLGTSSEAIDITEDRARFGKLLKQLDITHPRWSIAITEKEAQEAAEAIGYPIIIRPSYILGGRAIEIIYDDQGLKKYIKELASLSPEHPIFIDKFIEDAFEYDVDVISDNENIFIGGILHHIEEAGIHSGDSAMVLPAYKLTAERKTIIIEYVKRLARALNIIGLMNIQFAAKDDKVYVLEVNARASRTVPFISKAIGIPMVKIATKVILGKKLKDLLKPYENKIKWQQGVMEAIVEKYYVKVSVFPFDKFPEEDPLLGPEMKSTGEVMGISENFGDAFAKALLASGVNLPTSGNVFISVNDFDKQNVIPIAKKFEELNFNIYATKGTASVLQAAGIKVNIVYKLKEGRPNIVDKMINGEIQLIINTPLGREAFLDDSIIRKTAMKYRIPCITTLSGASAAAEGIKAWANSL